MKQLKKSLYMNILVPIDGSKYSEKALLHACNIAKNFESKITLLYVVEKIMPIDLLDKQGYLKTLQKFGNDVLIKGKKKAIQLGIDVKIVIKEGNVTNEITKFAKKDNSNLIIVGYKGLGTTKQFVIGSVSNRLANNSPCSILIIK